MTADDAEGIGATEAARRDRAMIVVTVACAVLLFAVIGAIQSFALLGLKVEGGLARAGLLRVLGLQILVNLLGVAVLALLLWILRPERPGPLRYAAVTLAAAIVALGVRVALELAFGVYTLRHVTALAVSFVMVLLVICLAAGLAYAFVASARRHRRQLLANARQRVRASTALAALQAEELRVRREVAEALHGTVQHRLVLVQARLDGIAERLDRRADTETRDELRAAEQEVRELREVDVREMSHLLYPSGVNVGLAQAARLMMQRVPPIIATRTRIADEVARADDPAVPRLSVAERMLLVRILEEGITNALRHGHASSLALEVTIDDGAVRLVLDDDGNGVGEGTPDRSGLALLESRIADAGGGLSLGRGPLGGARLVASLPLGPGDQRPAASAASRASRRSR